MKTIPEMITISKAEYDQLLQRVRQLEEALTAALDKSKELEARLNQNSRNSSLPPSSDGLKKPAPKSLRGKSGKSQGAQHGHKGKTLKPVDNPTRVEVHSVEACAHCGHDLRQTAPTNVRVGQIFDLPPILVEVTEHRAESKCCPQCKAVTTADNPAVAPAQYGPNIRALIAYLSVYQFLPFDRLQQFMQDCLGLSISDGLIQSVLAQGFDRLAGVEEAIAARLRAEPVIGNDETGLRVEGRLRWVHTASAPLWTLYSVQDKRGKIGMDAAGVLPDYAGVSVHDRFCSYDQYGCRHALCNAHLLRELTAMEEQDQPWASTLKHLLLEAKTLAETNPTDEQARQAILDRFDVAVKEGLASLPPPPPKPANKRGKTARPKPLRLLEVFQSRKAEVLRFLTEPGVPFDNNLAERDLRMIKLKQKISGCLRAKKGAEIFCRWRTCMSTARKQGLNVFQSIRSVVNDEVGSLLLVR